MTYAIIKVAGKQYRVREGERLLVDRLGQREGATVAPTVLLVGGAGAPELAPQDDERVKGMPAGYEKLTVAEIKGSASDWNRPMLEAALEYEQAHAKRKGALAALESALADKEGDS